MWKQAQDAERNPNIKNIRRDKVNYDYGFKGSDAAKPLWVFDDGLKTFMSGELFEETSGYLKDQGNEIFLLAPGSKFTDGYNPLDLISADPNQRITDLQKLTQMLLPERLRSDSSDFWEESARILLTAMTLTRRITESAIASSSPELALPYQARKAKASPSSKSANTCRQIPRPWSRGSLGRRPI